MSKEVITIIAIIVVLIIVWKLITAKLIKFIISAVLVIGLFIAIIALVTGRTDELPGGEKFGICAYDQVEADYFCVNHQQWECDSCHEKNK